MATAIETLLERARTVEEQIQAEWAARRAALGYRIEQDKVVFAAEIRRRHLAVRMRLLQFFAQTRPLVFLSAPVIYSLILPFAVIDLWVTLYQRICFPVYGIPRVSRRDFIFVDRHQLGYLNAVQKLNCTYCGYINGLVAYVREVAGRTEAYWCPIKHAARTRGAHEHYARFMDFGDEEDFLERWEESRRALRDAEL